MPYISIYCLNTLYDSFVWMFQFERISPKIKINEECMYESKSRKYIFLAHNWQRHTILYQKWSHPIKFLCDRLHNNYVRQGWVKSAQQREKLSQHNVAVTYLCVIGLVTNIIYIRWPLVSHWKYVLYMNI